MGINRNGECMHGSRKVTAAIASAGVLASIFLTSGTAYADRSAGTGTVSSVWDFFTGASQYNQTHNGDDILLRIMSGVAVDSRWQKCSDASVVGQTIQYNIRPIKEWREIGSNFNAGTCLKLQYRAYTTPGNFARETNWNQ